MGFMAPVFKMSFHRIFKDEVTGSCQGTLPNIQSNDEKKRALSSRDNVKQVCLVTVVETCAKTLFSIILLTLVILELQNGPDVVIMIHSWLCQI